MSNSNPFRLTACFAMALAAGCSGQVDDGTGADQTSEALGVRYGVDYSFARPSPATLRADGFGFVARYLSGVAGKDITRGEADTLIAHGLDVVVVWETTGTDVLFGYGQGAADARAAEAEARAVGQPAGRPIYFAIDFDAQPSQQGVIDAYFDGVASVIGRDRAGAYAGIGPISRLFDAGKIKWGWQTYAWSGGRWDGRAQLRQVLNGILGGAADKDQAVAADFGQWGSKAPAPPPPETGPAPAHPPVPTACGEIAPGHGLSRGQSVKSCDGRFELAMQNDGNLVLYVASVPLWSSKTDRTSGEVAVMQTDGNFVLYDAHSHPLFATGTERHPGAHLAIQGDGNVVVYEGATPVWDTHTSGFPAKPTGCGLIESGRGLVAGESVSSCDGHHVFVQQSDGNLVLYHDGRPTWASHTEGSNATHVVMQGDGNLVIYGRTGALWASHTEGRVGGRLAVQDDGNVVIYVGSTPVWATGTNGR